jgi:DNA-directed RNA polymerase subunit RPC12/RpoP
LTLSNVIIPSASGPLVARCPICGSRSWEQGGIFARCRKCGSEVTLWKPLEMVPEGGES